MIISGLSGNEIYCLSLKGIQPAELTVGNSVRSLGLTGSIGSSLQTLAGGEIANITQLISEGRHAAIQRMEEEARRHEASGVTGVTTELKTLSGYTEFLSQGTAVHARAGMPFFTSSASGIELYCHLDAGYTPMHFAMGNVAYALGIGRGLTGSLRTMAKGEVREYSDMYNGIRHLALWRLKQEAAAAGANAVVDVRIDIRPFGRGVVELLMTGTGAHHPKLAQGQVSAEQVVTSELTGSELWNLAKMGYAPVELVMATSVYSIGLVGGLGTMFSGLARGELDALTKLIYHARENSLELIRQEATRLGAERVVGNRLHIQELSPGLIEIIAAGTAVRRVEGIAPYSPELIIQAVIRDDDPLTVGGGGLAGLAGSVQLGASLERSVQRRVNPLGCLIAGIMMFIFMMFGLLAALMGSRGAP
ncbi:MAG: heavy metal-binding domain-containing protein [Deltaproteobacteria bacterium]|nr:heavy metal-binding domain-containing protein [Deltaproteobacteria bacterium]